MRNEKGDRAIGTLVFSEVRKAVLEEGKAWIDRAFVVNGSYIAACEPIRNIEDQIVGILYVGMLERPYLDVAGKVMLTFTGLAGLCIVFLLVILNFSTIRIIQPLRKMVTATREITAGSPGPAPASAKEGDFNLQTSSLKQVFGRPPGKRAR